MNVLRIMALALTAIISSWNVTADDDVMHIKLRNGNTIVFNINDVDEIYFSASEDAGVHESGGGYSGIIGSYEYVDLGLPSGLKWATCNIGAETPGDYGNYFAWGETTRKNAYTTDNSKWYGVSDSEMRSQGVIDSYGNLTAQYDAATVNWGKPWRIPTLDELKELIFKCKWTWTTLDSQNGYKVTGPNGNSIFLPASGQRLGSALNYVGSNGYYWSATFSSDASHACYLYFDSFSSSWSSSLRLGGHSIRPVTD